MRVNIRKMIEDAERKKEEEHKLFKRAEIATRDREQREEALREKEKKRIARFGNPEQQLFRTTLDLNQTFPTIIHCREHILRNSLSAKETASLEQRMKLTFADMEDLVDGSVEVRLLGTKTEPEEWVSFNENWRHLYPFNKLSNQKHVPCKNRFECKGFCTDNKGNRVYVLQFKDENSIYSGGTNKCVYWRYYQHSECTNSSNCDKLMYKHDPKRGFRWDLMHKLYSDDYIFTCEFNEIEKWLHETLVSCEYNDHGDGGKKISIGFRK